MDCLGEVYKNNVKGKLYRLLYEMNRNNVIKVKTAVGESEETETGENVGQGTLEGALISAISIGNGTNEFFKDSEDEVSYENIKLQPLLYQDDVLRISTNVRAAQVGNV